VSNSSAQIDFSAPAVLKKWPSINGQRANEALWPNPYLVIEGTLDGCIREFLAKPSGQRHLYEIHTAPQAALVTAIMSAGHINEIARLRDFL
jgi:hypothetical protein